MLLKFLWALGGVMLMAGFVVQPRYQAPLCFAISFISLITAALWTKSKLDKSKLVANASKNATYDVKTNTLTILRRTAENEMIFKIEDVHHLNFKYNPAELVYTGATTGSVTMGGFHVNEASISAGQGGKTGKFCIVYTGKEAADHHCTIRKVKLSGDMIKSAKSNYTVSKFLKDDTLVLEHATYTHSSSATRQASLDAFTSGRMDVFYGLNVNQYVDMQLTQEECQEILSWLLGKDVHDNGQSPEEKMYEQKKSLNRISSVLTLSIISGALGLLTTVMNGLYYDYIQVLLPVLVIAEGILLYKATQHGGTDTGNRLLLVSMILSALLAVYFGYVSIRVISVLLRGNIPIYGLSHICSLIASVIVFISAFKSKKKTTC